jgi:hypothetical protein
MEKATNYKLQPMKQHLCPAKPAGSKHNTPIHGDTLLAYGGSLVPDGTKITVLA